MSQVFQTPPTGAIGQKSRVTPTDPWGKMPWILVPFLAATLVMFLSWSVVMTAPASATERIERSVRVQGMSRDYTVYMPRTANDGHEHPVLFVFHPGGAKATFMETNAPFYTAAGAEDYVVVYPEGVSRTFNADVCCGKALEQGVDDVAFFQAMMIDIGEIIPIRDKAYVTGFSNGAMLTYKLVCDVPHLVAAAVPFAGAIPMDDCTSGYTIPVMHLNGGADKQSLEGGPRATPSPFPKTSNTLTPPLDALQAIARRNACGTGMAPARSLPAIDADCQRFAGCPTGGPVLMCVIPNLGHAWPGTGDEAATGGQQRPRLFSRLRGGNTQAEMQDKLGPFRPELDATGTIVAFFNRF